MLVLTFRHMKHIHEASAKSFQYVRFSAKLLNATGAKNLTNSDLGLYMRLLAYLPDFDALDGVIHLSTSAIKTDFGGYRRDAFFDALNRMTEVGLLDYSVDEGEKRVFKTRPLRGQIAATLGPVEGQMQAGLGPLEGQFGATFGPVTGHLHAGSNDSANLQTPIKEEIKEIKVNKERSVAGSENSAAAAQEIYFKLMPLFDSYPRKDGKGEAMREFSRTVKTADDIASLKRAIKNYLLHLEAHQVKKMFVKTLKTFAKDWQEWIEPDPTLLTPYFGAVGGQHAKKNPESTQTHIVDQQNRLEAIFGENQNEVKNG